jgi:Ca-activated chloride channel family protein
MIYFVRFVWLPGVFILLGVIVVAALMRRRKKKTKYRYSLGSLFKRESLGTTHPYKKIFWAFRFLTLVVLAVLIARPQIIDSRSNIQIDGIDIMLVLDASGSMGQNDFEGDARTRFDIAKEEAIRFAHKRDNDAIGLVIFAHDAISRCPITSDKRIVCNMISELQLNDINSDGTVLATSMITAANRLKLSRAKSKVMILLTDGTPSPHDMNSETAIEIAKKLGIKVYTIGVGSEVERYIFHPFYGRVQLAKVNAELLTHIAKETGGQFFMASDAADMRRIYETIDRLERTKHETPVFSKYYDIFLPATLALMGCVSMELLLSTFAWFSL